LLKDCGGEDVEEEGGGGGNEAKGEWERGGGREGVE